MTELSFLIELLLEHELGKETKTLIKERIREIQDYSDIRTSSSVKGTLLVHSRDPTAQAPSILAKYPDLGSGMVDKPLSTDPDIHPIPLEAIAKTPEAAKALADRQRMIAQSMSGKVEPGRTSPHKIGRS